MNRKRLRNFAIMLLAISATASDAAVKRCSVCRRALPSQYLVYEGNDCCSTTCVNTLRPDCSVCGSIITAEYIASSNTLFCSKACYVTTLPKCDICSRALEECYIITSHTYCRHCKENLPRCFSCGLPADHTTRLNDDREICSSCMRWAVKDNRAAKLHYERALRHLQAWTALELVSVPELKLVDRATINELESDIRKSDSPVSLRGLYSRQIATTTIKRWLRTEKTTTDVTEQIYLVDHLHDAVFRTAAIHELMHDLIQEHYPEFKKAPLWVEEGICQQAAAEYCRLRHYTDILYGIENCTDPDYGNGYRYIRQQVGVGGWPALRRWMENVEVSELPKQAPELPVEP